MSRIYPNLEEFLVERGIEREDSYDYGVWWRDLDPRAVYRLTWIGQQWRAPRDLVDVEPGELYAVKLGHFGSGPVIFLGIIPPSTETRSDGRPWPAANADRVLDGWEDICGEPNGLAWVRERITLASTQLQAVTV